MSNQKIRNQLQEAHNTNSRLMEDIHQLSAGWNESKHKLSEKESLWKESMEYQHDRSLRSHVHSLSLVHKDTATLKNEFYILKAAVKRLVY